MQNTIGGSKSKKKLALHHYAGERRVLEIGCSAGNLTDAFLAEPLERYVGIDIDDAALAAASKRFEKYRNVSFRNVTLTDLAQEQDRFDYVLFAGILHHVSDDECSVLLADALRLVDHGGRLVISEPEALRDDDSRVFRFFYKLEQGKFLRSRKDLEALVLKSGARIEHSEEYLVSPGLIRTPVARFNLIAARPQA